MTSEFEPDAGGDRTGGASGGGPLGGVRVLEVASYAGAPSCAAVLADWGADVVKLEPPGGDRSRGAGRSRADMPMSPRFEFHNRSKRSIVVDLNTPEGRSIAHRLLATIDVFITNLRPRSLTKIGLDPASVMPKYERLVFAHFSGYGVGHAAEDRPSTDHGAFWSASGFIAAISRGEEPVIPPGGLGDRAAGLALAGAIAAALFERERTGRGKEVRVSLLGVGPYLLGSDYSDHLRGGTPSQRTDRRQVSLPTLNPYRTADGRWMWLSVIDPEPYWERLHTALGLGAYGVPAVFDRAFVRKPGSGRLTDLLDEVFGARPLAEWVRILDQHEIPYAPVLTVGELADSDLARDADLFGIARPRPSQGRPATRMVRSPARFGGWEPTLTLAPEVGADTTEVLAEAGCSESEIERWRAGGVVPDE